MRQELFFATPTGIMVVPCRIDGGTFVAGRAEQWSDVSPLQHGGLHQRSFDLHPDGDRFVLDVANDPSSTDRGSNRVTLIFNFFEMLRQKMPI